MAFKTNDPAYEWTIGITVNKHSLDKIYLFLTMLDQSGDEIKELIELIEMMQDKIDATMK